MIDITKAHVVHDWTYERPLLATRFDPQGRYVLATAENSLLQKFVIPDGTVEVLPKAHESWIQALALSPDGNVGVSGGGDGKLVWWDLVQSPVSVIRTVEAHQGWVRGLAISPDGKWLATAGYDAHVHLFDLASGEKVRSWQDHETNVYSVCFFPDSQRLVSGDLSGVILQRSVTGDGETVRYDGSSLHSYNGGQNVNFGGVRSLAIDPQSQMLAAGGLHKSSNPLGAVHEPLVLQFNIADQKLVHSHTAEGIPGGGVWRLGYLADGHLMGVSGGSTGGFLLFWKQGQDLSVHNFKLPSLARDMDLSRDGRLVATAHYDRHLRVTELG